MPRAPYNVDADVFCGGNSATPYAFRFTIHGRLVDINREPLQSPSALFFDRYFTWNGPALTTGDDVSAFPVIGVDLSTADFMEIPPGSNIFYTVVKTEVVAPVRSGLVPYRRAYVLELLI